MRQRIAKVIELSDDAKDIARDHLRRLPDYDGDETEPTARHNLPEQHFHVTVNNGSKPDIELEGEIAIGPAKLKAPHWVIAAIGLVIAGVTAFIAWLARSH